MQGDEARVLLGFPPNSCPSASQVKAAYKRKVWESHPDLFPFDKKTDAESKFKLIRLHMMPFSDTSKAAMSLSGHVTSDLHFAKDFQCVNTGARGKGPTSATNFRVARTGVAMANGGRRNHPLIGIPFLFIIMATIGLGGFNSTRAYKRQKEAYPSHNPFLTQRARFN